MCCFAYTCTGCNKDTLFSWFSSKNLKTICLWITFSVAVGHRFGGPETITVDSQKDRFKKFCKVYELYKIPLTINLWDNVSRKEYAANVREKEGLVHNLCLYRQSKIGSIFAMDLYSNNYQLATSLTTHP